MFKRSFWPFRYGVRLFRFRAVLLKYHWHTLASEVRDSTQFLAISLTVRRASPTMLDNRTGSFLFELSLFVVRRRIGATNDRGKKNRRTFINVTGYVVRSFVTSKPPVRNLVSTKITSLPRVKNQGWDFSFESRQWPSSPLLYARLSRLEVSNRWKGLEKVSATNCWEIGLFTFHVSCVTVSTHSW